LATVLGRSAVFGYAMLAVELGDPAGDASYCAAADAPQLPTAPTDANPYTRAAPRGIRLIKQQLPRMGEEPKKKALTPKSSAFFVRPDLLVALTIARVVRCTATFTRLVR